ncbi:MAG: hypothetical protein WBC44_22185 [Planctomycetaceae bacterium]
MSLLRPLLLATLLLAVSATPAKSDVVDYLDPPAATKPDPDSAREVAVAIHEPRPTRLGEPSTTVLLLVVAAVVYVGKLARDRFRDIKDELREVVEDR